MEEDTIVAVATPPGRGGIGVVRISGPESLQVASLLCPQTRRWPPRRAIVTTVVDAAGGKLDEAVVVCFRAPRSYTGEDVVEIACHGSPLILDRVVVAALSHGCRVARPGEFTLRAFLSGRIDLTQAEAVVDLVEAKSDAGLGLAMRQLEGELSQKIEPLRSRLLDVLAHVTAIVDFSEDDIPEVAKENVVDDLEEVRAGVQGLIAGAKTGSVLQHGVSLAIVGAPNVGKSSILNALLGRERAIVTAIAGTTRDTVEDEIQLNGISFRVIDTAGIAPTVDVVEAIGMERTRDAIESADVVLVVLDGSRTFTTADRHALAAIEHVRPGASRLVALNKDDLPRVLDAASLPLNDDSQVVLTSATAPDGLRDLRRVLPEIVLHGPPAEGFVVSNARHVQSLQLASQALDDALSALTAGLPVDLVALDMRAALGSLSAITGVEVGDDVLDRVFQRFCIGK